MRKSKDFIKALAVFSGTVIGVGIFSLPYVTSKAGILTVFFYFLIMAFIAIITHFIYGEVALGTEEIHRLPGYVEKYLGPRWKKITLLIIGLGLMGALLAYLIVGGSFLNSFFGPFFGGNEIFYTLLFFAIGTYLIFRGIKSISQVELALLGLFFVLLLLFFIKAIPFINLENFKTISLRFFTFPYGVVLFSLWGSALVPEIKEMVKGDRKELRKVIFYGITIAAVTYLFFIFVILGVSGSATSKEALSGFIGKIGDGILKLGFIFGVICCFTSFITLGLTLKKVFWYDFGLSPNFSWFITSFLPLTLFLLGVREFIEIIGFTGALMLGAEGLIIVFLYRKFLTQKFSQKMKPAYYILAGVFVLGIIFEILHFVF